MYTYIYTYTHMHTYMHNTHVHIHTYVVSSDPEPLQLTATHCNSLQLTATHCNSLQHTATQIDTARTYTHTNIRFALRPRALSRQRLSKNKCYVRISAYKHTRTLIPHTRIYTNMESLKFVRVSTQVHTYIYSYIQTCATYLHA